MRCEYTLTYDGNGNDTGDVPSGPVDYDFEETVTVLGNTNNLAKTGYTFDGWNTKADGSGDGYLSDDTFDMPADDVTLYAQWRAVDYSVTYDGNGSISGTVPSGPVNYHYMDDVTVLGNTGSLALTGYTFDGWNTSVNGSGTPYAADATFAMPAHDVTLYAQWKINKYTVTFLASGPGHLNGTETTVTINNVEHGTLWSTLAVPTADPDSHAYFVGWSDTFPATVTGNLSFTATFAEKTDITLVANSETYTYNGTPQSVSGFTGLPAGLTITGVSASRQETNAGTYPVTFTVGTVQIKNSADQDVTEQYSLHYTNGVLKINKAALTVTAENKSTTYGSAAPAFTVQYSGFVNGETSSVLGGDLEFTCSYEVGDPVGPYAISPHGLTSSNYLIMCVPGTLTVNNADMTVDANGYSGVYDGLLHDGAENVDPSEADATITYSVDGGTYSATMPQFKNVGTHTVTVKASKDNYNDATKDVTVTITKASLTVTAQDKSTTYGTAAPAFTVQYSGFVNGETSSVLGGTLDFDCDYEVGDPVGDYDITPKGLTSGNYSITFVKGTLTVNNADMTVDANGYSGVYDGLLHDGAENVDPSEADATITYSVDGGTYSATMPQFKNVGTHTVTVKASKDNYNDATKDVTVEISKAALTVTAQDKSTTYGTAAPAFTVQYSGFVNGETSAVLGGTLDFDCDYEVGDPVGDYDITPKGLTSGNYSITFVKGTLTVNNADMTVDANGYSGVYDGLLHDGAENVDPSEADAIITYSVDGGTYSATMPQFKNVGTHTVTVKASKDNYNDATKDVTVTITKASLTVTAQDKSTTYGTAAPAFTVQYSGFVNGETSAVLGGTLDFDCDYEVGDPVGDYDITPKGLTSGELQHHVRQGHLDGEQRGHDGGCGRLQRRVRWPAARRRGECGPVES